MAGCRASLCQLHSMVPCAPPVQWQPSMLCVCGCRAGCVAPQTLLAYRSVDYAWAEPMQRKELLVTVVSTGKTIGVFSLDRIGCEVVPAGGDHKGKVGD